MPMRTLAGKTAVITGGGSGIGAGVARACHDAGMKVAVVDIDHERATRVAAALTSDDCPALGFTVDVSRADAVVELADEVFTRFGACHLLHNNAGVCPLGRAWAHSADEWQRVIGINLLGVANGVNAFVPRMLERRDEAHIVNTASASALRFTPASTLYNATKFGVVALSESLRADVAPFGIGVSILCPGGVATNISDSMQLDETDATSTADLLAEFAAVDPAHVSVISSDLVGELVVEAVRNNDPYIITHPGSLAAVHDRHESIEECYRIQRERHPELP
jgi:NAD(P)-dependent dehydrogenase (short-subunit alcohol dehydrogenase family)